MFAALQPTRLLFSHYGPVVQVSETLDRSAEEITVWVEDDRAEAVAERIMRVARTGRIGDGKIFVVPLALPEPLAF